VVSLADVRVDALTGADVVPNAWVMNVTEASGLNQRLVLVAPSAVLRDQWLELIRATAR
jgi:hypothetical protein